VEKSIYFLHSFLFCSNRKVVERYSEKLEDKEREYEQFGQWTCLNRKH